VYFNDFLVLEVNSVDSTSNEESDNQWILGGVMNLIWNVVRKRKMGLKCGMTRVPGPEVCESFLTQILSLFFPENII